MTLSGKTVLALAVIIPLSTILVAALLWFYLSTQFGKIEKEQASRDMARFRGALEMETESVDSFCKDFAYWDDTYDFMIKPGSDYIKANFNLPYLKSQSMHFICIHDVNGRVLYSAAYEGPVFTKIEPGLNHENSCINRVICKTSEIDDRVLKGLVKTPYGILVLSSRIVTDNTMKAPARGRIITGRFLNSRMKKICSIVKADVKLLEAGTAEYDEQAFEMDRSGREILFREGADSIRVYSGVSGAAGCRPVIFRLNSPRGIRNAGLETVKYSAVFTVLYGLIMMYLIVLFLKKTVLNPLGSITDMTSSIREEENFSARIPEKGKDEISVLAGSFNSLLDKLSGLNFSLEARVKERTSELSSANRKLLLMEKVFENSLEGIVITDKEASILKVNPAFTNITGYEQNEVVGENPRILKSEHHGKDYYEEMWSSLVNAGYWANEIWNRHKDGKAYPEWISISAIKDEAGEVTHYVGLFHDISDMKRQEQFIRYQAFHDALTGLPNRLLLENRMSKSIAHADRNDSSLAVIFLDLDNFKNINDSLGHSTGDLLLRDVAARLQLIARQEDTVARHGGDEFIIMLEDIRNERPAVKLARRIISAFREPFSVLGRDFFMGTSMGIALYPDDGEDADTLISNADAAMYRSKERGRHTFTLYTPSLNQAVARKLKIENDLRNAIDNASFDVYYQPKVRPLSGETAGMEGLVRWRHEGAVISPDEFIPLAEEAGLISEIDRIVMNRAFEEMAQMSDGGIPMPRLALNCSARSLLHKNLSRVVGDALVKYSIEPALFEIEITETSIMQNIEQSRSVLYELMEMGISIALDDFGTGYSSLAQLTGLPISCVKIDRSFIMQLDRSTNDAHVVESVIAMSRKMGVEVVAEGVESECQYDFLKKRGCDLIQGYYISRPVPVKEFELFLKSRN